MPTLSARIHILEYRIFGKRRTNKLQLFNIKKQPILFLPSLSDNLFSEQKGGGANIFCKAEYCMSERNGYTSACLYTIYSIQYSECWTKFLTKRFFFTFHVCLHFIALALLLLHTLLLGSFVQVDQNNLYYNCDGVGTRHALETI